MEAPLIDDLAKSKDLIGDLLKLSKSQLLNIWKRLWPLSEKDFCMQYGLTKSTDATLSNSEVVLEAPCPNCKTMIILEKHARFDCPNCTKYNSWYIKINKNQLSSITNIKGDNNKIFLRVNVRVNDRSDSSICYALCRFIFITIKNNIINNCHTDFATGWNKICNYLVTNNQIKTVIFIDGDQAIENIFSLNWLLPIDQSKLNFHIIVIVGAKTAIPPFWPFYSSCCSWLSAPTGKKQAADLTITALASALSQLNNKFNFWIVSRDLFAESLAEIMIALNQTCLTIDPCALDLTLLLVASIAMADYDIELSPWANNIKQFFKQRYCDNIKNDNIDLIIDTALKGAPAIAYYKISISRLHRLDEFIKANAKSIIKAKSTNLNAKAIEFKPKTAYIHPMFIEIKAKLNELGQISLNVLGQRWPWNDELTNTFKCSKWLDLVSRPEILDLLDCDLHSIPRGSHMLRARNYPVPQVVDIDKLEVKDLIYLYTIEWPGTLRDFCLKYNCNEGNFRSFISGRRAVDAISCAAIRRWLLEK